MKYSLNMTKSLLFDELMLLPMNHMMNEYEVEYISKLINIFYKQL